MDIHTLKGGALFCLGMIAGMLAGFPPFFIN
jgi:hypothetical protein